MVSTISYVPITIYLKDEETKKQFKKIIVEYGTGHKAIRAFIEHHESINKPKFI
jgi:hypothetical protein